MWNFKQHVKFIGEEASVSHRAMTRMMQNKEGPNPFQRIVKSIMLYAFTVWWETLTVGTPKRKLSSVYNLIAVRQISGFSKVSDEALLVLVQTIPVDILADKMRGVFFRCLEYPRQTAAIKANGRRTSIYKWRRNEITIFIIFFINSLS